MEWEEWVRFVAAPTVLALLAAWIATRNSRKTPHERLKNLVDIEKNMPDGADPNSVVITAIARELVDFDRRIKADQLSRWARWKEWFIQNRARIQAVGTATLLLALVLLLRWVEIKTGWPSELLTGVFILALGAFNLVSVYLFREEGNTRQTEQTKAEGEAVAATTLNREARQFFAYGDSFPWTEEEKQELKSVTDRARAEGLSEAEVTTRRREYAHDRLEAFRRERNRSAHQSPDE